MLEIKPLTQKSLQQTVTDYNEEFAGRLFSALQVKFGLTLAGTVGTAYDDAPFALLDTPELNQGGEPLCRAAGPSWRHMDALFNGTYSNQIAPSATGAALAYARIPFNRIMPLARVDATQSKVYLKGRSADGSAYDSGGLATYTGILRPYVETVEALPQRWARPNISESTELAVNSDNVQHAIRFDTRTVLAGFMLRCYDASAHARTDGMVRRVKVEVTKRGQGPRELISWVSWGALRQMTARRAGWGPTDYALSAGVVYVPTVQHGGPWPNAILFSPGESLTITFDMNSTIEEEFTALTFASPDRVFITGFRFQPVEGEIAASPAPRIAPLRGAAARSIARQAARGR